MHAFRRRRPGSGGAGRGRRRSSRGARRSSASSTRASASLREKIETIATRVYGADGVDYSPAAARQLDRYEHNGFGALPICIAKTHLSISSDPALKGAPTGWRLPVREVRASVGAGFVYPICGDMRTMPGLPSHPAAERIDIDENGDVVGLS